MRYARGPVLWLLQNRRDLFIRLKGLAELTISRDAEFLDVHAELVRDTRANQSLHERYNLYRFAQATARLAGAIAEAGVYRGGTAKLLCRAKGEVPLYLFDTFEGLPAVHEKHDPHFGQGQFSDTSLESVRDYLAGFPNVHFYKGFFPASAQGMEPERQTYRLVHLDLDLYQSTLDALGFFYPRMTKGGLIVSHDYSSVSAPGVKKAFDEFFADKIETVIPLWDTQCVVCKA